MFVPTDVVERLRTSVTKGNKKKRRDKKRGRVGDENGTATI